MKSFLLSLIVAVMSFGFTATEAEAKRLKASGRALPAQSTAAMPSAPAARAVQ